MTGYTSPLAIPYPTSTDSLTAAVSTIPQQAAEKVDDLLSAVSGVNPSGLVALTAPAGWSLGGASGVWRRAAMAHVHVVSNRVNNTAWGAGEVVARVPVGYRPLALVYVAGVLSASGALITCYITSAGDVITASAYPANSGGVNLDLAYAI